MVFDYKNNREEATLNGIVEKHIGGVTYTTMRADNDVVSGHTFLNFPKLSFYEDTLVTNCTFEDCGDISFEECRLNACVFSRVTTVSAVKSTISNSDFYDLATDLDPLVFLEDSKLLGCSFDGAELRDEAYLCDAVGDSTVDSCSFVNIRTEHPELRVINCEEERGIFKKKVQYDITSDCTGLEDVEFIDE